MNEPAQTGMTPESLSAIDRIATTGEAVHIRKDVLIACNGDFPLAIMVSRILFFSVDAWRDHDRAGWVYMSNRDWARWCHLTSNQVERCNRIMNDPAFPVETELRQRWTGTRNTNGNAHAAPVKHYRVTPAFSEWIRAALDTYDSESPFRLETESMDSGLKRNPTFRLEPESKGQETEQEKQGAGADAPAPSVSDSDGDRGSNVGADRENGADAPKGNGGADAPEPAAADPKKAAHAYRSAMLGAFIRGTNFDPVVTKNNRSRWMRDLKQAFPDAEWDGEPSITPEQFERAAAWQKKRVGTRFVPSPKTVLQDWPIFEAESRPIDPAMIGAVIKPYVDDGRVAVPKKRDVEAALRSCHTDGLEPADIYDAVVWKWRQTHRPPKVEHLRYTVGDWEDAGKPAPR